MFLYSNLSITPCQSSGRPAAAPLTLMDVWPTTSLKSKQRPRGRKRHGILLYIPVARLSLLVDIYGFPTMSPQQVRSAVEGISAKTIPPIVIVFGRPGSGKTTVAEAAMEKLRCRRKAAEYDRQCLEKEGLVMLDLDVCVPQWMRDNFAAGIYPTLEQRREFADDACRLVEESVGISGEQRRNGIAACLVSFSFVNADLRDAFRSRFPLARWILIDTSEAEAQGRIEKREGHFYKGKRKTKSTTGAKNTTKDIGGKDVDNAEWNFAPVSFPHTVLDGMETVDANSEKIVRIVLEVQLRGRQNK